MDIAWTAHDRLFTHLCAGPSGNTGAGRELLARLALHMGGDPLFASFNARELLALREMPFSEWTSNANERVAAEFLQECFLSGPPTWNERQLEKLRGFALPQPERRELRLVRSSE